MSVFHMPDTEYCLVAVSTNLHIHVYAQLDCKFPENKNSSYLDPSDAS